MRHYYDSRAFPFLSDLLFDQLLNFDWESSRKEIEEERKKTERSLSRLEAFCKKGEKGGRHCNYLRTEDTLNNGLRVCTPEFKLEDGVYTYVTNVGKNVKPEDIKIDATDGSFLLSYSSKSDTGSMSVSSFETLPEDLDEGTLKAVLKNGVLTVTANQVPKVEKKPEPENDDVEYEIEIGK